MDQLRGLPSGSRHLESIILLAVTIPTIIALAMLAYRSSLLILINNNEGWNAYHSIAAVSGGQLYYPANSYITNNYPPLSFYVVGLVARIVGDAVFAGRIVSWISLLSVAATIYAILWRTGNDRAAAWLGAVLFVGYSILHFDEYIGSSDPQWLAHAIVLGGLYVFIRQKQSLGSSIAAGLVMGCGLFVKHNIVALPMALALWLLIYDRRAFVRFAGAGLILGALGLSLCALIFKGDFFSGLMTAREYSAMQAYRRTVLYVVPMQLPIALVLMGVLNGARHRLSWLFLIYLTMALAIGAIMNAGAGVAENSMFETVIALSLAAGHLVAQFRTQGLRLWGIGVCAGALIIATSLAATRETYLISPWVAKIRSEERVTKRVVAMIADRPGPAVCELIVLCYWAKKKWELDAFNFREGVLLGTKDDSRLRRQLEFGYFSSVEFIPYSGIFSKNILKSLETRYALAPMQFREAGALYFRSDDAVSVH